MATLNTEANIAAPDDFYERLIALPTIQIYIEELQKR